MGEYVLGRRATIAELSLESTIIAQTFYLGKGRFLGERKELTCGLG
jgi:hypothetical protein